MDLTYSAIVLPNGNVAIESGNKVRIFYHQREILEGHSEFISKIGFLSTGDIVTASYHKIMCIWDSKTFEALQISEYEAPLNDMADDSVV